MGEWFSIEDTPPPEREMYLMLLRDGTVKKCFRIGRTYCRKTSHGFTVVDIPILWKKPFIRTKEG
jgi:hypothetical protein